MSTAQYMRERRKKHKAEGLCSHCNSKVFPGAGRCLMHLEVHRFSSQIYRKNHQEILAEKSNRRRNQYQTEGRCIRCSAPLIEDERNYCVSCIAGRHNPIIKGIL